MKHQTKVLIKTLLILLIAPVIFLFGVGVGAVGSETEQELAQVQECPECPKPTECPEPKVIEREVEVEKVVYKDSPETVELLGLYKDSLSIMSEAYITVFEVTDACAAYLGEPVHQDFYDVYDLAVELYNSGI